ncbi:hypothetical protein DTO280E4_3845 [Paecilomyces variotii]|nr:hypothetical protein DTO169E5_6817 [Paecilomyces variotii]KAJ9253636.1 hypothetical protein DTO207G8_4060 [Paecilomyces variotii]KAJ9287598.1 hypothetical protein DTO021C3_4891 [Paecilomyces variotii]KAJ9309802.1 hypothetical protein DTO217A2_753 [Paecilomyces variotii]KAJ9361371.1 hypothetical protein DTO280E4_3845 [Paecilomyces variotii]
MTVKKEIQTSSECPKKESRTQRRVCLATAGDEKFTPKYTYPFNPADLKEFQNCLVTMPKFAFLNNAEQF